MENKRPIKELLEKCITKVEEHYKVKDLYRRLSQGINVQEILEETVEDYKEKMQKYILETLEEIKHCCQMIESLQTEQKKDVECDLQEYQKDLYCTLVELFELYHFFRSLENLSKEHLEEAVSIPVDIIYNLLLRQVKKD